MLFVSVKLIYSHCVMVICACISAEKMEQLAAYRQKKAAERLARMDRIQKRLQSIRGVKSATVAPCSNSTQNVRDVSVCLSVCLFVFLSHAR